MPIRILDAGTVGRIAAGEVVERPSSVAKELIENALDAGATAITVEIREGGIQYLRVTDNGCGIQPEEVRLAFENHATSKLQSAEDLNDIRTMGFRGEALPSIAAVSKVRCTTRGRGCESGVSLRIEGGKFISMAETGCPEGTTIVLEDLFFNTPVRKAFLKKPSYEAGVLMDLVSRMMLGNPRVAMRLINNGKTVYHTFGDGSMRHAVLAVYGKETAQNMTEIDETLGSVRISGLIGTGDCGKPTRAFQSFYINGRLVRCPLMSRALENACKTRVTIGMYPMCALSLTLPSHAVDVNVHPNKLEVRFKDETAMQTTLEALLSRAFRGEHVLDLDNPEQKHTTDVKQAKLLVEAANPAQSEEHTQPSEKRLDLPAAVSDRIAEPSVRPEPDVSLPETGRVIEQTELPQVTRMRERELEQTVIGQDLPETAAPRGAADAVQDRLPTADLPARETEDYRLIGVVFDTYLILQTDRSMILIDQHAAHERILYEKYMKLLQVGKASQQLLLPEILPVSRREMQLLQENSDLLRETGYDIEPFGENTIRVRAVPYILGEPDVKPLFLDLAESLGDLKYAAAEKRRLEIMQMSCKHAVKGGEKLSADEIHELLNAMRHSEAPPTCPHGRPVARQFTKQELEKMFKRIQ